MDRVTALKTIEEVLPLLSLEDLAAVASQLEKKRAKIKRDEAKKLLGGVKVKKPLLSLLGEITIPENFENFVAAEKFVISSTEDDKKGRIARVGQRFTKTFLGGGGKIEPPTNGRMLPYSSINYGSSDTNIIHELGGEEVVESTLYEILFIIGSQGKGQKLLTPNIAGNFFYVRDAEKMLRVICVFWCSRDSGWVIDEVPKDTWMSGRRVFGGKPPIPMTEPVETAA